MDFRPMNVEEQKRLQRALERNAAEDTPVYMDPRTTKFVDDPQLEMDAQTINAIRSVPTHYSVTIELAVDSLVCHTYCARITGRCAQWFFRPPVPAPKQQVRGRRR